MRKGRRVRARGRADPGEVRSRCDRGRAAVADRRQVGAGVAARPPCGRRRSGTKRARSARFGVGFAAVLAVSDAPQVVSATGAVGSPRRVRRPGSPTLPGPAAELARRDAPPVLRLVWPSAERPPEGYATEVRLPLRPGAGRGRPARPRLAPRRPTCCSRCQGSTRSTSTGRSSRGRRATASSRSGRAVAGRATHGHARRRGRRRRAAWAAGVGGDLGVALWTARSATTLRTPPPSPRKPSPCPPGSSRPSRWSPTADGSASARPPTPCSTGRRPPTSTWCGAVAPGERLALVPSPGFPRSPLDGQLRARIVDGLRAATWLPAAGGGGARPWSRRVARRPRPRRRPARAARRGGVRPPRRPAVPPGRARPSSAPAA